jgi:HTH-type transcriptional regulator / antitoxin HigA
MKLKPIKTIKDYETYLEWIDQQFDKKVGPNSPEGKILKKALALIKDYEDKNYSIPVVKPRPKE